MPRTPSLSEESPDYKALLGLVALRNTELAESQQRIMLEHQATIEELSRKFLIAGGSLNQIQRILGLPFYEARDYVASLFDGKDSEEPTTAPTVEPEPERSEGMNWSLIRSQTDRDRNFQVKVMAEDGVGYTLYPLRIEETPEDDDPFITNGEGDDGEYYDSLGDLIALGIDEYSILEEYEIGYRYK